MMGRHAFSAWILLFVASTGCAGKLRESRAINPASLPTPKGYSHGVEAGSGRTVYLSGEVAVDKSGAVVGVGDVKAQAHQVFKNLNAALEEAGGSLKDVVKLTVFMTDISQAQAYREVRATYFSGPFPASTVVQVSGLVRPELLIEVDAIAVVPKRD